MNDFDQEKIDRLLCDQSVLSPYEKVLIENERRARWRKRQIDDTFDWFVKDSMGDFYNYDPKDD